MNVCAHVWELPTPPPLPPTPTPCDPRSWGFSWLKGICFLHFSVTTRDHTGCLYESLREGKQQLDLHETKIDWCSCYRSEETVKHASMRACTWMETLHTSAVYLCKTQFGFQRSMYIWHKWWSVHVCVCACMSVPLIGYGGERLNVPGVHLWVMATVMSWKHNLYLPSLCVRKKGQEQKRDCVCASQY